MELTDEERKLIEDYRQRNSQKEEAKRNSLHLIQTAASFLQWLYDNGRGATFSTFTEEFYYEGEYNGWTSSYFYDNMLELIHLSQKLSDL